MSHRTIYQCNHCGKEIGEKTHITLLVSPGRGTGIAVHDLMKGWDTIGLGENFIHFCTSKCIAAYFEKRLVGAGAKNDKHDQIRKASRMPIRNAARVQNRPRD